MYCPKCDIKRDQISKFCSNCGARLVDDTEMTDNLQQPSYEDAATVLPLSRDANLSFESKASDAELRAFVGKNYEKYARRWATPRFLRSQPSWNWSAFFAGPYWFAYRKMYWQALVYVIVLVDPFFPHILALVLLMILLLLPAMSANHIYRQHVESRIAKAKRSAGLHQTSSESLGKSGGTSAWAVWLFIGIKIAATLLVGSIFDGLPHNSVEPRQQSVPNSSESTMQTLAKPTVKLSSDPHNLASRRECL